MAVDTIRVDSSLGVPPIPKEEGEVAENLRILQMREAKLSPLFAALQQGITKAASQSERDAFNLVVSIIEITPIETIIMAERIVRFKERKRLRVRPHSSSCTSAAV
jgi:hypothetical protein